MEFGCDKIIRSGDLFRIQKPHYPLTGTKAFQIRSTLWLFWDCPGSVMTAIAMAAGASLGEELWPLCKSIIAQELPCPFRGYAFEFCQNTNALGLAVCSANSNLIIRVVTVLQNRKVGESARARQQTKEHPDIEAMSQLPFSDEGHDEDKQHYQGRYDNCSPNFGFSREEFQKLEKEQKVPIGSRGGEWFGRICRRAKFCAPWAGLGKQRMAEDQKQNCDQNCQTGNSIPEDLVRPESRIGLAQRLFGSQTMAPKEVNVTCEQNNDCPGNNSCVQGEETCQCKMAVIGSADDYPLQGRSKNWNYCHQVCSHFGGPKPFLIPRKEITRQ